MQRERRPFDSRLRQARAVAQANDVTEDGNGFGIGMPKTSEARRNGILSGFDEDAGNRSGSLWSSSSIPAGTPAETPDWHFTFTRLETEEFD